MAEDTIEIGGLYYACDHPIRGAGNPSREQSYNFFVALKNADTGDIWMMDTYKMKEDMFPHLEQYSETGRTNCFIERAIAADFTISDWWCTHLKFSHYYNNCTKLDQNNENQFKFLCNLKDMREIGFSETRFFDEKDVVEGVKLWMDHGYPGGVNLVRKDASTVDELEFDAKYRDFTNGFHSPHTTSILEPLEAIAEKCPEHSDFAMEIARMRFAKMKELETEWNDFWYATTALLETNYDWSALRAWKHGVPIEDIIA